MKISCDIYEQMFFGLFLLLLVVNSSALLLSN